MMTRSSIVAAVLLALAIGVGPAWAEDPAPAPKATTSSASKKAISKACSDQANAKGLHGKERRKFRAECKAHGGKAPE
jgi:psiF repeat